MSRALSSPLPPDCYGAPERLLAERERLFGRGWLLAGMLDQLAQPNDFVTLDAAGTAVAVHNFDGELRAFHNVCSHRFALIHAAPAGNRLLRCPYHGWTYDRDGVPYGIPGNQDFFGFDQADQERIGLQRFAVDTCGRFVFVRLAADGPSLADYLGPYRSVLEAASIAFPDRFDDRTLTWQANWKLGLEVVLEVYHAPFVHPESFGQFAGRGWDCSYAGTHSRGIAPVADPSRRWWAGIAGRLKLERCPAHRDYDHYFLFPNLAIGITEGLMMSVQTYTPRAADRMELRFRLFLAPGKEGAARRAAQEHLRTFNMQVLEEDRALCESAQVGQTQTCRRAVLGANEERIAAFHTAYAGALGLRSEN